VEQVTDTKPKDGRSRARQIECRWCGKDHTAYSHLTKFCSDKCKAEFNELRAKRAKLVYDIVMSGRFDRKNNKGYLTTLSQVARQYRDEDIRDRAGRQSWAEAGYFRDEDYIDRLRATPAAANEEKIDG
jgi:predicted nucleic acid-binding Zn ribbon protein